ncbi:hypothetical protein AVEN_139213-1, partial [Araneus ventricosus]
PHSAPHDYPQIGDNRWALSLSCKADVEEVATGAVQFSPG